MTGTKRDPPRWFKPVLFGGMLLVVVVLGMIAVLTVEADDDPLIVGERTFIVPPEHIISISREPPLFVRIKLPDRPFEIIHDARSDGLRDQTGVPHIFSINDQPGHDVWYGRDERTLFVCRRASSPFGGCGTWIRYGGAQWSVLFPESRVEDADRFAREAAVALRRYGSGSSRLIP